MEEKYLTVKEIWDFIDKIMPGAIQKDGDRYSLQALECLFFVTENQGKRLTVESTTIPRSAEWKRNRDKLIRDCKEEYASWRQQFAGSKEKKQLKDAEDKFIEDTCAMCSENRGVCALRDCRIHPEKDPPKSFREQLTWVVERAIMESYSPKDVTLEFLNKKKFQKASMEAEALDENGEAFYTKMAEILVGLVDWRESDKNDKAIQKINRDFQKQKGQILQLRDKLYPLGKKYREQWWQGIAEILAAAPSAYGDSDLDEREEDAQNLAEEGNYERANSILSSPDWKNEIRLLGKLLEEERSRCRRYISGQKCLIKNLLMKLASKDEVIEIYEEITHLSEEYQIEYSTFQEYSEFLFSQKEYDKGIEVAKRLNQHYKARNSIPSADIAKLYIQFGELYYAVHDFEKSICFCNDAKEILEKDPLKYTMELARVYNTMSDNYWKMHDPKEAKDFIEKALKLFAQYNMLYGQLLDEGYLSWAHTYKRLATILRREWNLDEAAGCYKKALDIEERLYEKDQNNDRFSQALAVTYSNLGILCRHMKRYEEGEKCYQKSYDIRRKKYENNDDLTYKWPFAITATNYAYLLACAGRQSDAEAKMEGIVLPIKKSLLEEHPDSKKYQSSYALSQKDYAFVLSCADPNDNAKWERADQIFSEMIAFVEQRFTKNSKIPEAYEDLLATADFEYGCLLKKMGKKQEAITRFRGALDIFQDLGKNGSYCAHEIEMAALELAELLSENKYTWTEAKQAYQQALEFGEKIPETSQKYHQDVYERTLKGFIDILEFLNHPEDQQEIEALKEKLARCKTKEPVEAL